MFDFLKNRPMLLCALVASALSVVGIYAEMALLCFCPLIVLLIFAFVYKSVRPEFILVTVLVLLISVSTLFALKDVKEAKMLDGTVCNGEFIVVKEPENHGEYYSATLEAVDCEGVKKGWKISAYYNKGEMKFGERINVKISLSAFKKPQMEYSFYSNGIFLNGFVTDFTNTGDNDVFLSGVGKIRNYIKESIFKYYSPPEAATMLALVTGDKSYFTDEFYGNVKSAGVAHVMVVSGMHLSVIVALALYLTNKFFYNRFFKAFIILFVTFSVMVICGFTMSILRAGVTYIFMALALVTGQENTPENTLGAAVSMILLFNPFAIANVAFQLSVLSTFSILVVALPINEYIAEHKIIKQKWLLLVVSLVLISLSALIFTAPVTIYVFGYVSNVSIITNLLISSAVSMAMNLCLLGFVIPFTKALLFPISAVLVRYINSVINYFGSLPFATTDKPGWLAFLMVGVIVAILWILVAW